MKCPLCNTEMRITASSYVMNEGTLSMKQEFICRNKTCGNYNKIVRTQYIPLHYTDDSEAPVENTEEEG